MKAHFSRFMPQPLTAIMISILALIILIAPWVDTPTLVLNTTRIHAVLIAIFLSITIISAGMNPIHFQHNIKVFLTTVPLYVAAMLLPPAVAALTAGISILIVQLHHRFSERVGGPARRKLSSASVTRAIECCSGHVHLRYRHSRVGNRSDVGRTNLARDGDFAARN